jgi:hypothetical protein
MSNEYPPQFVQWLVSRRELRVPPSDAGQQYAMDAPAPQAEPGRLRPTREEETRERVLAATA